MGVGAKPGKKVFKSLLSVLILFWLLPALACNLPARRDTGLQWLPTRTPSLEPDAEQPLEPQPSPLPGETAEATAGIVNTDPATPTPPSGSAWDFPGLKPLTDFNSVSLPLEPLHHERGVMAYLTQPGDTLSSVAGRFGVEKASIQGVGGIDPGGFLPVTLPLAIPIEAMDTLPDYALLPDSEIPYGPSAADFDITAYIAQQGGILAGFSERVDSELLSGAQIVQRVALDTSTNPRLLLAFLEFRSGWVLGEPKLPATAPYPLGFSVDAYRGLYKELILSARFLSQGLYGWRTGELSTITFASGGTARIHPGVNAGTAAATVLVTKLFGQATYQGALYGPDGFLATYQRMFGDPWARAAAYEPVFTPETAQNLPTLELPFRAGERWNMTSGPHIAWGSASPWGALDFAPSGERSGCYISTRWATAAAAGLVVRSERGMVFVDLDGDGKEQTGLVLLYLHISSQDRVAAGTWLEKDQPLGHPSCEGGVATGTHVHLTRKYNGEWLRIGNEMPMVLSGWSAFLGERQYLGGLMNASGDVVTARSDGSHTSLIVREN